MAPIDDATLRHSLEASQRRQAEARARRERQKKRFLVGGIVVALVVPTGILLGIVTAKAPTPPLLVLTWPKPKVSQTMASGQSVVNRDGDPMDLAITKSSDWDAQWRSPQSENSGEAVHWSPVDVDETMTVNCTPQTSGIGRLASLFWPKPSLTLRAIEAKRDGAYVRSLDAGSGTWLYPFIFATGKITWNERSMPLLAGASQLLPDVKLESSLAEIKERPSPAIWQVVNDFEAKATSPAGDGSTYAVISAPDLENLMPKMGRYIIKEAPDVSIKFVIRLDQSPQRGVFRLAFDGKKERRAWIRRPGQKAGGPLDNWDVWEAPAVPPLPPGMPN